MKVLIAGCGYVGTALARALHVRGVPFLGLARNPQTLAEWTRAGWPVREADVNAPDTLRTVERDFTDVVDCVAAGRAGGVEAYEKTYHEGMRNLIAATAPWLHPPRLIFTSSTSVYGQNDGSVVEEDSSTDLAGPTGAVLVRTERLCLESGRGGVLRLAGIYGPGRGMNFKRFMAGEAVIEGEGRRHINQIHREDIVGVIVAVLERPALVGETFNVVDDAPVTQRDFYGWLAERTGKPMPPTVPAAQNAERTFGLTDKRISNRKMRERLGHALRYPTFREGLEPMIREWESGSADLSRIVRN
ncbi:MAG: SDR family oxidoreductase [Verrucomicrobiae bacterium]|nr:SDR family oxidoreductase [Verrucomicrobiae bacterium]